MAKWSMKGLIKFGFRRAVEGLLVVLLVLFIPGLPPFVEINQAFKVAKPLPFQGALELKESLSDAQIWHKGDFLGPEALEDVNGELYTSIYGGDIVKLTGEHITPVVKFGRPCKGMHEEKICGRPLGMSFDKDGFLYAADAYYGIFKVNVKTGEKQQLVSPKTKVKGKFPKIFNSVVVASTGDIYWTDSSTEFSLEDGLYTFLADPSGRLVHYDPQTKKNTVLIEKIHFANGIALSQDEDFIVVAETVQSRIHRYYLKGPKKGTSDIFIEGLPGVPDNIKADGKGGFIAPLVDGRDDKWPAVYQLLGPFPLVRKALARFLGIGHYLIREVNQFYPTEIGDKAAYIMGHFTSVPSFVMNPRVTILRLNGDGKITHSVHNLNKKLARISEAHVFGDTLYLGSPYNDYIGKISLDKIGWGDLKKDRIKRSVPVESAKPQPTQAPTPKATQPPKSTTATPKSTTTTPKPATQGATTTQAPPTTQKPTTQPPATQKPITQPPATQKPSTQVPVTQKPVITQPPAAQKPSTQAPVTQKPTTQPPATQKPSTQAPAAQKATPQAPAPKTTGKTAPKPAQAAKEAPKPAVKATEAPKQTQPPKATSPSAREAPKAATQPPKATSPKVEAKNVKNEL